MVLAPLATVPLGVLTGLIVWSGAALDVPPLATAFVALALLAAGSRALHLDGLSDVADGLTASYDSERSLAVMKGGTAGPAGVAALVLVLGAQAAGLAALVDPLGSSSERLRDAVIAGLAVCVSRAALWLVCAGPVPPARPDGLGATFAGRVPVGVAAIGWLGLAGLAALIDPVRGPIAVTAAAVVVVGLIQRTVRRFGGITGDVIGAAIELALAVLLIGAATI